MKMTNKLHLLVVEHFRNLGWKIYENHTDAEALLSININEEKGTGIDIYVCIDYGKIDRLIAQPTRTVAGTKEVQWNIVDVQNLECDENFDNFMNPAETVMRDVVLPEIDRKMKLLKPLVKTKMSVDVLGPQRVAWETEWDGKKGICFAETRSKAKYTLFSLLDEMGYGVSFKTFNAKCRRAKEYDGARLEDGRMPNPSINYDPAFLRKVKAAQ